METLRDRAFLKNARTQLDADHYGLEKIKKRLIEYLAVVRLKALQLEQEERTEQAQAQSATGVPPPVAVRRPKTIKGPILL